MSSENTIKFWAQKVHLHHWPPETPEWKDSRKNQIENELNKNKENKLVEVLDKSIRINNFKFLAIKKVGITVPLFKKECTMIFEGQCQEFDAHVHITTKQENFLEIFNKLMNWRTKFFSN